MIDGGKKIDLSQTDQAFRNSSGSLAIPTAIRRAALRVNSLARDRRARLPSCRAGDSTSRLTLHSKSTTVPPATIGRAIELCCEGVARRRCREDTDPNGGIYISLVHRQPG